MLLVAPGAFYGSSDGRVASSHHYPLHSHTQNRDGRLEQPLPVTPTDEYVEDSVEFSLVSYRF